MTSNDLDSDLPRLHVVVTANLRLAFDDARRDPTVISISENRARAETRDSIVRFVPARQTDVLRGLRAASYAIHWTALRDAPPGLIREIREIMNARRIPQIAFLSGQRATPLQAETIESERVLQLYQAALEIGGGEIGEAYSLLICATALATLRSSGNQWEAFTDIDVALQEFRKLIDARASAPVTF